MSRPVRRRQIGGYPDYWSFSPDESAATDCVFMTLDEYETVRLLDLKRLTQEQCALRMGVCRTTVTAIYDAARRKLAEALVDGKRLKIAGGSYELLPNAGDRIQRKDEGSMRLAITYDKENGEIFLHFGRTEHFKLYDVREGRIVSEEVTDTGGNGHGALAGFLKSAGVDALICGGIGMGARTALQEAGIALYPGVTGSADEAAKAFAEGRLSYDPESHCDHHGHHENTCYPDENHCGEHAE